MLSSEGFFGPGCAQVLLQLVAECGLFFFRQNWICFIEKAVAIAKRSKLALKDLLQRWGVTGQDPLRNLAPGGVIGESPIDLRNQCVSA